MSVVANTVEGLAAQCEDRLLAAGVLIDRTADADLESVVARGDLLLREVYRMAEACQRWLLLRRPVRQAAYDPRDLPRILSGALRIAAVRPRNETDLRLAGDIARIIECLKLLVENARLAGGDAIRAELRMDDAPAVLISLDGRGALPETLCFEGYLELPLADFDQAWAEATGGGQVHRAGARLLLELTGDDPAPLSNDSSMDKAWEAAGRLARRLRSWRGATGHHEPGLVSVGEMRMLYRQTIQGALEDLRGLRPRRNV